ncbi:MAG: transaldolase family protein, partial [Verrucomicrobiota bacterium]
MNEQLKKLKIKLFADGAEIDVIREMAKNPLIQGFTTNPTLMRKAGLDDYVGFSKQVIQIIPDYPLSLEVFSDDFSEMEKQAKEIASWGKNVFVKIPVTNTKGEFCGDLVKKLSAS